MERASAKGTNKEEKYNSFQRGSGGKENVVFLENYLKKNKKMCIFLFQQTLLLYLIDSVASFRSIV